MGLPARGWRGQSSMPVLTSAEPCTCPLTLPCLQARPACSACALHFWPAWSWPQLSPMAPNTPPHCPALSPCSYHCCPALQALTFLANSAQIVGFQGSQASRGAFLLRTSIIGTPLLASLAALPVAPLVWVGCLTGFAGGQGQMLNVLSHRDLPYSLHLESLLAGKGVSFWVWSSGCLVAVEVLLYMLCKVPNLT